MSEEVYMPNKDWFSDNLGNELTVDEIDAGAVCVTVEGTDDTMMMNCSGGGGNCSIALTPDQTRALFRYLAGIVLPQVEREEGQRGSDIPAGETRFLSGVFPTGTFAKHGPRVDIHIDARGPIGGLYPAQARALVACLLAAIDEAEGAE